MRWWLLSIGACASGPGPTNDDPTTAGPTADTGPKAAGPVSLLVNGDAERCTTEGWSTGGPVGAVTRQDQGTGPLVLPVGGACFFSYALEPAPDGSGRMRQQGDAVPGTTLRLSGRFQTMSDPAWFTLTVDDADGGEVAHGAGFDLESGSWTPFGVAVEVPEDGVTWTLELGGELLVGSFVNVFYDEVELVQEP